MLGTEKHPGLYQSLLSIKPNSILTVQTKVGSITSAKSCTTTGSYCSTNCTHCNKTQGERFSCGASESRAMCGLQQAGLCATPTTHSTRIKQRLELCTGVRHYSHNYIVFTASYTCLQTHHEEIKGHKEKNQTGQALEKEPSRGSFDCKASSLIMEITPVSRGKHTEQLETNSLSRTAARTPRHLDLSYSLRQGCSRSTACQNSLSPSSGELAPELRKMLLLSAETNSTN